MPRSDRLRQDTVVMPKALVSVGYWSRSGEGVLRTDMWVLPGKYKLTPSQLQSHET